MTALEDDIARVARLRGRTVEECLETQAALQLQRGRIALSPERIGGLFLSMADTARDLRVFDRLPAASRSFMREETQVHVCATKWAQALDECGDEAALLAAVRAHLAENMPWHAKHAYGPNHPAARSAR